MARKGWGPLGGGSLKTQRYLGIDKAGGYANRLRGELQKAAIELGKHPPTQRVGKFTPLSQVSVQPNPKHVTAAAEVKKLEQLQRDLLRRNGYTKTSIPKEGKALQEFFREAVSDGKIKKIPSAQKAMMKKLGRGVLGSVWKKAAAAVIGPTAIGASGMNPWSTGVGFVVGLGMAAWTVWDVYNLGKDLMGDD